MHLGGIWALLHRVDLPAGALLLCLEATARLDPAPYRAAQFRPSGTSQTVRSYGTESAARGGTTVVGIVVGVGGAIRPLLGGQEIIPLGR